MRLGPKAQVGLANQLDSNQEPFNSMCYVVSHYANLPM